MNFESMLIIFAAIGAFVVVVLAGVGLVWVLDAVADKTKKL